LNAARVLLICCIGVMLWTQAVEAEREVVLVAAAASPLQDLDSLELRKIYLGFPVKRDGNIVSGLRNTGDETLNRIFLQSVVAMSEKSYIRRLLSLPLRQGTPRPSEYDRSDRLLDALSNNPYSVTYMWKDMAARSPDVKTLRVLWHQD
jgi:hypothetical protein